MQTELCRPNQRAPIEERDLRPRVQSTNCSHILFLLLKFHHYIHQLFEVLWLLDGALEQNVFEIVMYSNLLAQLYLVQDLMPYVHYHEYGGLQKKNHEDREHDEEQNRFSPIFSNSIQFNSEILNLITQ